jgi:hypothetical protein
MNTGYDNYEAFGESLSVRGEGFWHSVWKRIENVPGVDSLPGKSEVSLEAPRDYVVSSKNHSTARSA